MIGGVAAAALGAAPKPAELVQMQMWGTTVITHKFGAIVITNGGYHITAHITTDRARALAVRGDNVPQHWARLFSAIFADQLVVPAGIEADFTDGEVVTIRRPWVLHGDATLARAAAAALPRVVL